MKPNYVPTESTVKPQTIEVTTDTIYLRKDFSKETRNDMSGKSLTYWTYLEAKMTKEEFNQYAVYLNLNNIEQLINGNNDLVSQSASIAVDTEYLVCLAEFNNGV